MALIYYHIRQNILRRSKMKDYSKPIVRRQFFKKGILSGAILGILPLQRLFNSTHSKIAKLFFNS